MGSRVTSACGVDSGAAVGAEVRAGYSSGPRWYTSVLVRGVVVAVGRTVPVVSADVPRSVVGAVPPAFVLSSPQPVSDAPVAPRRPTANAPRRMTRRVTIA